MITVITFGELEKLYRDNALAKSDSFDFLNESAQKFLREAYAEDEKTMADIIYLVSLDGKEIKSVDEDLLTREDSELLAYLPELEEQQIIILAEKSNEMTTFSGDTMREFDEAGLVDESERQYYEELLQEGADVSEDAAVYAVSTKLNIEQVKGIMYPPELEDKVAELRKSNEVRGALFKSTVLFG